MDFFRKLQFYSTNLISYLNDYGFFCRQEFHSKNSMIIIIIELINGLFE